MSVQPSVLHPSLCPSCLAPLYPLVPPSFCPSSLLSMCLSFHLSIPLSSLPPIPPSVHPTPPSSPPPLLSPYRAHGHHLRVLTQGWPQAPGHLDGVPRGVVGEAQQQGGQRVLRALLPSTERRPCAPGWCCGVGHPQTTPPGPFPTPTVKVMAKSSHLFPTPSWRVPLRTAALPPKTARTTVRPGSRAAWYRRVVESWVPVRKGRGRWVLRVSSSPQDGGKGRDGEPDGLGRALRSSGGGLGGHVNFWGIRGHPEGVGDLGDIWSGSGKPDGDLGGWGDIWRGFG